MTNDHLFCFMHTARSYNEHEFSSMTLLLLTIWQHSKQQPQKLSNVQKTSMRNARKHGGLHEMIMTNYEGASGAYKNVSLSASE